MRLGDHIGRHVPGLLHGEQRRAIIDAERHVVANVRSGISGLGHARSGIEARISPERRNGIADRRRPARLALAVLLMTSNAELGVDRLAASCIRRLGRLGDRPQAHAGDAHAFGRPLAQEFDIGDQRLHLAALGRQILAVHAPPHAAIEPLRQRQHLVVDEHREGGEGRDERRGEGLESGFEVTVLAG